MTHTAVRKHKGLLSWLIGGVIEHYHTHRSEKHKEAYSQGLNYGLLEFDWKQHIMRVSIKNQNGSTVASCVVFTNDVSKIDFVTLHRQRKFGMDPVAFALVGLALVSLLLVFGAGAAILAPWLRTKAEQTTKQKTS
mmetsp:Transcript_514/g.773  ORF Transcript_514/g.773 Transcript_514/m.773 type:complete len:136 (+) Transcript_514:2-409(+)